MTMIYSCSTCDTMRVDAPLCVRGEAAEFNDEMLQFVAKGKCTCICHHGSANVTANGLPVFSGPGAFGDPNDNGEGFLMAPDGGPPARARERELVAV